MKQKTMQKVKLVADGITPKMEEATNKKFALWDEVLERKLLDGDKHQKAYVYKLLKDPTIYLYAFFKDPGDNDKPMKLYPYQDLIINDPKKRIIFDAANQIGKSITLCGKAIHFALTNPGKTVVMVSKTLPQSKDLLRQVRNMLQSGHIDYKDSLGDYETKTELYFRHYKKQTREDGTEEVIELPQSRIICLPATEAILGYAIHLLLIDELAFYEDGVYFYNRLAQPRTYTTKGQIIVFSNPNGQQGIFWKLWLNPIFNKYRFKFLDCPTNTEEEYLMICKSLSQEEIDSTLDAIFTSPQGGFISLAERLAMQDKDRPNSLPSIITRQLYIFLDFAKVKDRTVRSIGYTIGKEEELSDLGIHVCEMVEYPQGTSYNYIVDELENLIKEVGPDNVAMVGWDNTGVGAGIEDFIRRIEDLGIMCMPVNFSLENKSRIYTHFKLLIERNLRNGENGITIPFVEECDRQLSKLVFKKSPRGYLQVHHDKEKDRDDFGDSLSGLCSLIIQPENVPVSLTIIGDDSGTDSETDSDESWGFV